MLKSHPLDRPWHAKKKLTINLFSLISLETFASDFWYSWFTLHIACLVAYFKLIFSSMDLPWKLRFNSDVRLHIKFDTELNNGSKPCRKRSFEVRHLPVTRIGYAEWFLANHHWFFAEMLLLLMLLLWALSLTLLFFHRPF